jgi:heme-degrading monooxygenase HmoA
VRQLRSLFVLLRGRYDVGGRLAAQEGFMLTTVGMHYEVRPGKEDEFEKGFIATIELLKTLPGHIESHLYEDVQSVGSYVILSQWKSKADFDAFLRSPEFGKAVAWGKAEILRARPKHTIYTSEG